MENNPPYTVAHCFDSTNRLSIWRNGEKSPAGYLVPVAGGYQIEREPEKRVLPDSERPVYEKQQDAELVVYMRGRAYRRVFDDVEVGACFEIRVSMHEDEQWVASLWRDDKPAGMHSVVAIGKYPSQSLEEAKYQALTRLYGEARKDEPVRRIAKEEWPDVKL
jgi:hypothetical protein